MNYRSYKPWVTQDSDDSDDEIRLRHVHRRRIRSDQRRGINTIPVDNQSPINSSSPSVTSHSQSNTSSSESGWLSTRKIRSDADRTRFREDAARAIKKSKPIKSRISKNKFKIGTVCSSVAIGELLPLEKGRKRRTRKRLVGKVLQVHPYNSFEWMVCFPNGRH